ncbi:Ivy family c-type lysozyme inhibitor [Ciceribacter selenitireducens]|nr:Ivy family c-type lysozyme inhibitor [Ciceribacter selenitireducens]
MRTGRQQWASAPVFLLVLLMALAGPPVATAAEPSLSGNFLPAVLAGSEPHRQALVGLIRGKPGLPAWVRNMVSRDRYVALASKRVEIEGKSMQLFAACQPGNCAASALRVLYSQDGKRAVLRIADVRLGTIVLGEPNPAELDVLAAD